MSLGEPALAGIARLLAILAICFFVGAVNPAALVARALGKDVRGSGSRTPALRMPVGCWGCAGG